MTTQTMGLVLIATALLLAIFLQFAPVYLDNRASRYVRPKRRRQRRRKGVAE